MIGRGKLELGRIAPDRVISGRRAVTALAAAALLGLTLTYVSLIHTGAAGPKKSDFVPYYAAARLLLGGHGSEIYSEGALRSAEASIVRPYTIPHGVMPYLYPPFFAVALAPLAALPFTVAFWLWACVNCCLLLSSLALLRRMAFLTRPNSTTFWVVSLSFFPVLVALTQGQTSVLLLALLTLCCGWLRSGRDVPAGIALAAAAIKPPMIVPLLLLLALTGRWRALTTFAITCVALAGAAIPFSGASSLSHFANTLWQAGSWTQQIGGFQPKWNDSVLGAVQLLVPLHLATPTSAAIGATLLLAFALRVRGHLALEHSIASALVVGLLISPHVLVHDLTLLLIPVCLAIAPAMNDRWMPLLCSVLYISPLVGLVAVTVAPVQLSVVAMLVFLFWLVRHDGRRARGPARASTGPAVRTQEVAC